ncbi:MAG TPA: alpha/beta fold hydrolase [Solimonas sp.]|nr:alpha/beta fold hydrolase [Solimonas sp.]
MSMALGALAHAALRLTAAIGPATVADRPQDRVVLLHGLGRSAASMSLLGGALQQAGFEVCNVDYPSRQHPVAQLAECYVAPQIERHFGSRCGPVNFVTHSLGGIVVRQLAQSGALGALGRVVMLAPPNQGSELVDWLSHVPLYRYVNGPAGIELGTGANSIPNRLGAPSFELGVIAGKRTLNPVLSAFIRGPDDGKVSVARTRLDGMRDFAVVDSTHTFIMNHPEAIERTIRFLRHGSFAAVSDALPAGRR